MVCWTLASSVLEQEVLLKLVKEVNLKKTIKATAQYFRNMWPKAGILCLFDNLSGNQVHNDNIQLGEVS